MRRAAVLAGALVALAACGGGDSGNGSGPAEANGAGNVSATQARSLGDTVAATGDLSDFARALAASGLADTLKGGEPYTVFAPANAAFAALPEAARTRLMAAEGRGELTELVTVHIVPGFVTARDLDGAIQRGNGRATLATVAGPNISVSREGDSYVVGDAAGGRARITRTDVQASNGVIHQIDALLVPAGEAASPRR